MSPAAARTRKPDRTPPRKSVPGLDARAAATAILRTVAVERRPLDAVLEESPRLNRLGPADRSLVRAIVSTAIRRRGQIRDALARLMERPPPRRSGSLPAILETAAAQILFMAVPDHAAVSTAVEEAAADRDARHFKGLVNAVLRALVARREEILAAQDAARLNTPDWLWARWTAHYGAADTRRIAEAHLGDPPLDLTVKADPAAWAEKLGGEALATGTVRLAGRGRIEDLPGFADGDWWVQDAAAALPARLLGDVAGLEVLDLCAAPGGKTAQLALAGAKVTAVDISPARLERLSANLARLGLAAKTVTADALAYDPGRQFDAVLLDAPCLATGTIRRHPDVAWLKTEADIIALAGVQAKLVERATMLTKPGGLLVYATCSLEPEEGEAQAEGARRLPLEEVPIAPGEITGLSPDWLRNGRLRTLPFHAPGGDGGMDGFFAARFRRR